MSSALKRKLVYLALIPVLYVPLYLLSLPPTKHREAQGLYKLREEKGFGAVTLGEVDPTSQTLNFVLVGMRGIAANLLWQQANRLQDHHQWTELKRTIKSITLLQPHFVKVWDFQGWNLAYNVSVEWDNVEDRYYWVKEGIRFLEEGAQKNPRRPELPWRVGRTYSHKLGQSDETSQFRKLFKEDREFNPTGEDNFLVAKRKYEFATELGDDLLRLKLDDRELQVGMAPVIFYSAPSMAQTNYALAMEREGTFGERAQRAWQQSGTDWVRFGGRSFMSEAGKVKLEYTQGEWEQLNDLEKYWCLRYRSIVNYDYWKNRCAFEAWEDEETGQMITIEGRRLTHLANAAFEEGDLVRAKGLYEQAMEIWKRVVESERFSGYMRDASFMDGYWVPLIQNYRVILTQLGELAEDDPNWPPEGFALKRIWDEYQHELEVRRFNEEMNRRMPGQGRGMGGGGGAGTGGGDTRPREEVERQLDEDFERRPSTGIQLPPTDN